MKPKVKNNIYKVLYKKNRNRNIKSFFVLVLLTAVFLGVLWTFLFLPVLGIITQQRFFAGEQFEKIDVYGITDGNGYIEFLDENYNVIYPKNSAHIYTAENIENMVNVYSVHQKIKQYKYIEGNEEYIEIISGTYDAAYGWYVRLDSSLRYAGSANFYYIKDIYTPQDIDYILNDYIRDLGTYKYDFISNAGNKYTMVIVIDGKIEYLQLYEILILYGMGALLVLMYTLFIIFSTSSTSKLFKKPLNDLSNAINDFSTGKYILIDKEYQVDEFNSIVAAFNNMVITLLELEQKNTALAQQKQSVIANISHDLKTPITVIQGYIEAIRAGKIPEEETQDYLNRIYSKAEYMTALINSFADFSRLNHPRFELNLADENLCDIVRNYLADMYNYIVDNGMEISVDIPDDIFLCKIDKYHFERSLANIISNFIKYNKKGTLIHVAMEANKAEFVLTMENNGTPIEKQIAENVFEPLVTGDRARSDESTGLGLASAKRVIELHGGNISYKSTKEYANSFRIILPAC